MKSGGRCAFDGCRRRLAIEVEQSGRSAIVSQAAHIVTETASGPRGESPLTLKERNSYPNLMLLCLEHHKIVNDDPDAFTVDALLEMKAVGGAVVAAAAGWTAGRIFRALPESVWSPSSLWRSLTRRSTHLCRTGSTNNCQIIHAPPGHVVRRCQHQMWSIYQLPRSDMYPDSAVDPRDVAGGQLVTGSFPRNQPRSIFRFCWKRSKGPQRLTRKSVTSSRYLSPPILHRRIRSTYGLRITNSRIPACRILKSRCLPPGYCVSEIIEAASLQSSQRTEIVSEVAPTSGASHSLSIR